MRSIEWTLRVLVGVIGLALTSIALGIFLSDGRRFRADEPGFMERLFSPLDSSDFG